MVYMLVYAESTGMNTYTVKNLKKLSVRLYLKT